MDGCLDCDGVNTCKTCDNGFVLQNGVCLIDCEYDNGYYFDETSNSCQKCHFSCSKCFDSSTYCISCQENMTYDSTLSICICNDGYIWEETNKNCLDCGDK